MGLFCWSLPAAAHAIFDTSRRLRNRSTLLWRFGLVPKNCSAWRQPPTTTQFVFFWLDFGFGKCQGYIDKNPPSWSSSVDVELPFHHIWRLDPERVALISKKQKRTDFEARQFLAIINRGSHSFRAFPETFQTICIGSFTDPWTFWSLRTVGDSPTKAYNSPSWIAVGLPRRAKVEISKTKLLEPRLHSPFPSTIRQPCMADLPGCFNCGLSYLEIEIKYRSKPKERRLHRSRQNLPAIPTLWRTKAMMIVFLLIQCI